MKKILIVEDDIYLLKLYKEVLEKEGYETQIAEDGREALEKAESFSPDMILLDLMLPYIDGFEVLRKLKGEEKHKDIKVIVFTNLDSETQRKKAKELGAVKFVVKVGDNPGNIIKEVREVLSKPD